MAYIYLLTVLLEQPPAGELQFAVARLVLLSFCELDTVNRAGSSQATPLLYFNIRRDNPGVSRFVLIDKVPTPGRTAGELERRQ